jgi:hypothetical protein
MLTLDGDVSVHTSQKRAMKHYLKHWCTTLDQGSLLERIDESDSHQAEKSIFRAFIVNGIINANAIDFGEFLERFEDVCFYKVFEMDI